MKNIKLGFCGASVRIILIILNILFLILGIVVFSTAAVLKWSTLFNKFTSIKGIEAIVKAGSISSVSTVLLIVGGFAIAFSLLGLCGVKYLNRCLLIVYEIVILILFLTHGISILVLIFKSSKIENEFRKEFNNTITFINDNVNKPNVYDEKCKLSYSISEIFDCCGAQGPKDFLNQTLIIECCKSKDYTTGCNDKVVKTIKNNAVNLLGIPSAIILGTELFALIMVPFLIRKARNNDNY